MKYTIMTIDLGKTILILYKDEIAFVTIFAWLLAHYVALVSMNSTLIKSSNI